MSDYCMNIVRQNDPDRFLLSLFAPRTARPALWALFAFNYEIAKTREVVSETNIGLIRLQWWRDTIAEIYEDKPIRRHEIVQPLADAIKNYDLPRELFDKLIYAREFDLEDVTPTNLEGLLNYCEYTSAPLFQLALKIVGQDNNNTVIVDISKRYALIGAIRAVPYMLNQRRMMLPADILANYNLSPQKIFDFNEKNGLPKVIKDILSQKKQFRNDKSDKKPSKFLKKVQLMTRLYEGQIKSAEYDVFKAGLSVPPRFFALRLWAGM